MAFMETLLSLIFFLSSALLLHSVDVHEAPESITLNLIHPFSVHSPFYPGKNITDVEKMNLLIQATEARMQHLFPNTAMRRHRSWNGSNEVDDIATLVKLSGLYYVAEVGIGSFPPDRGQKWKTYFLIMDTGSHITWVQCEGCDPCLPLSQPNFPYPQSRSYRYIPCDHHDCPTPREDCYSSFCGFKETYGRISGPTTKGAIVGETLTFVSDSPRLPVERFPNFFLGCAFESYNYGFPAENKAAGILGLGRGGRGTSPLWMQVKKRRFSYCLVNSEQASSKLYIGEGARMAGHVKSMPLLRGSNPALYYVELQDISIAGVPLGLKISGGSAIDSGAPVTFLASNVYARVRARFVQYFAQFNIKPYDSGRRPRDLPELDLCFPNPSDFNSFPTMTFHFRGADLVVQPIGVFKKEANYICVALLSDEKTIFGAFQQVQHRFSYDLELGDAGTLFFAPEDCGARA